MQTNTCEIRYTESIHANNLLYDTKVRTKKVKRAGNFNNEVAVRSSQSRKYAGNENIANVFRDEAVILEKELVAMHVDIESHRTARIAKGYGDRVPLKFRRKIADIQNRIGALKRLSKELKGDVDNAVHEFLKPEAVPVETPSAPLVTLEERQRIADIYADGKLRAVTTASVLGKRKHIREQQK